MTETAGPQGGPPPSVGRGPWSEAFEGERGGGKGGEVLLVVVVVRWGGLTRLSAQTHIDQKWNLNLKHLKEHFVLQSQNKRNESECWEMKAAQ